MSATQNNFLSTLKNTFLLSQPVSHVLPVCTWDTLFWEPFGSGTVVNKSHHLYPLAWYTEAYMQIPEHFTNYIKTYSTFASLHFLHSLAIKPAFLFISAKSKMKVRWTEEENQSNFYVYNGALHCEDVDASWWSYQRGWRKPWRQ